MLFTRLLTIVANGVGLARFIERLEPEEVDTPIQKTTDSGLPVGLHVVVTCLGGACVCPTSARPSCLCGILLVIVLKSCGERIVVSYRRS